MDDIKEKPKWCKNEDSVEHCDKIHSNRIKEIGARACISCGHSSLIKKHSTDLSINELYVTQSGYRSGSEIKQLRKFISVPGNNWEKCKIYITKFEDGKLFIHDGHHRVLATLLSGRVCLNENEFEIHEWKYQDYINLNFSTPWYTPFDPRIESRLPDVFGFKFTIRQFIKQGKDENYIKGFIMENKNLFCAPKKFNKITEWSFNEDDNS